MHMGVKNENIIFFENMTRNEIQLTIELEKDELSRSNSSFLFVYVAGQGTEDEEQVLILNSKKANLFPIEKNIRSIAESCEGRCQIFSVYDICHKKLDQLPELLS